MDYSISTKWNVGRHHKASDLVDEVRDLGFETMEVGCDTPLDMYEGLLSEVRSGRIRVSSVHNYCPAPTDRKPDGDSYLLSDLDPRLRDLAVSKTLETLERAYGLQAKAVVLHLGRVEMEEATSALKADHDAGKLDIEAMARVLSRQKKEREAMWRLHFDAVCESLDVLVPRAESLGLRLGLENRLRYRQIPLPAEVAALLGRYGTRVAGYWHDMGHAEFLARLGFLDASEYFEFLPDDGLLGCHIHDVRGLTDHLAPGEGDMDLAYIAKRLPVGILKVLELSPKVTREGIGRALSLLPEIGI